MKLTPKERARVAAIRAGDDGKGRFRLVVYLRKRIRCGKPRCGKCGRKGPGHGPYWYGFWRDGKRVRSLYIGKKLKPLRVSR